MQVIKASPQNRNDIIRLLQENQLPTRDLYELLTEFYVALENDKVIGLIGMEKYGQNGLIRSMVVDQDFRNRQIARLLVERIEEQAIVSGLREIYLLTETAAGYFEKKGYVVVARNEAPVEIKASSEFSYVCPESAVVMKKQLV